MCGDSGCFSGGGCCGSGGDTGFVPPASDPGDSFYGSSGGSGASGAMSDYQLPPMAQAWVDAAHPPAAPTNDFSSLSSLGSTDFSYLDSAPAVNPTGGYEPPPSNDYSSIAPNDFSNLGYLTPEGSPAGTFAPEQATATGGDSVVPGYGVTDLSGLQPSGGGTPPSAQFDPGIPAGAEPTAGVSPTFATLANPSAGSTPTYTAPGSSKALSASDFTFNGPAGASGTPNVAALNASPLLTTQEAPSAAPALASTGGAGLSAAGNQLPGVGGGAAANDLSQNRPKKEGDTDFLSNFGIKNPLGTALAAGGLAYALSQGNKQTAPVAALNTIAAPAAATGQALTNTGASVAVSGADKLNALSTDNQATGKDLLKTGTDTALAGANDLKTLSATNQATGTGLTDAGTKAVTGSINDLKALAAPVSTTGQQLQTTGAGLTNYVGTGKLPPEMQVQVDQAKSDAKTARISFYASKGMPTDPAKNTSLRSDLERIDRDAISMAATMASDLAKTGTTIYSAGLSGTGQSGNLTGTAGNLGTGLTSAGTNLSQLAATGTGKAADIGTTVGGIGANTGQLAGNEAGKAADIGSNLVSSGVSSSGLASNTYNQLAQIDAAQTANTQKAIAAMAAALGGGTPPIVIQPKAP